MRGPCFEASEDMRSLQGICLGLIVVRIDASATVRPALDWMPRPIRQIVMTGTSLGPRSRSIHCADNNEACHVGYALTDRRDAVPAHTRRIRLPRALSMAVRGRAALSGHRRPEGSASRRD